MKKFDKFLIVICIISAIVTALIGLGYGLYLFIFLFPLIPFFWFAPHILIYGIPIRIGMMFFFGSQKKIRSFTIAIVGIGLIAALPSWISTRFAQSTIKGLMAGDVATQIRQTPRHIEFTLLETRSTRERTAARLAPCEEICQKLLTGEEVNSVTVRTLANRRNLASTTYRPTFTVTYRLETHAICPSSEVNIANILPYTLWLSRRGTCIIPTVGAESHQDTIRISSLTATDRIIRNEGLTISPGTEVKRVEIIDPSVPENEQLRFRQTEVGIERITFPLHLDVSGGSSLKTGWEIVRSKLVTNAISLEQILRDQLGYKLELPEVDVALSVEPEILILLDRPGTEESSSLHDELISTYAKQLEEKANLTNDEIEILRRIISDTRLVNARPIAAMLRENPALIERLLPEIIGRIAVAVPESIGHSNAAFAGLLPRIDPDLLNPFANQIVDILENDGEWTTSSLLTIVGRLDKNPAQTLSGALSSDSETLQLAAVRGICNANYLWRDDLLPHLVGYMNGLQMSNWYLDLMTPGIVALRRFGKNQLASNFVAEMDERTSTQMNNRIARHRLRDNSSRCIGL